MAKAKKVTHGFPEGHPLHGQNSPQTEPVTVTPPVFEVPQLLPEGTGRPDGEHPASPVGSQDTLPDTFFPEVDDRAPADDVTTSAPVLASSSDQIRQALDAGLASILTDASIRCALEAVRIHHEALDTDTKTASQREYCRMFTAHRSQAPDVVRKTAKLLIDKATLSDSYLSWITETLLAHARLDHEAIQATLVNCSVYRAFVGLGVLDSTVDEAEARANALHVEVVKIGEARKRVIAKANAKHVEAMRIRDEQRQRVMLLTAHRDMALLVESETPTVTKKAVAMADERHATTVRRTGTKKRKATTTATDTKPNRPVKRTGSERNLSNDT